ncbi:hypothetical protein AMECASPLE_031168, partial [Ameca splendens]
DPKTCGQGGEPNELSNRGDVEGQESSVAGTEHAQSVSAAGCAGSLYNNLYREPECDWLCVWSYCC